MNETDETPYARLPERLAAVTDRIRAACERAGRDPVEVRLVAVAKGHGPDAIAAAAAAGIVTIGENRVQEAAPKAALSSGRIEWHMVGHLQTNKVRPAVELFHMIHSVDSDRLLEAIHRACEQAGRTLPVCLEVNVSGERSKFGLRPEDVPDVLLRARRLPRVDVVGLMTIPPFDPDPETTRGCFRTLRALRDEWRARCEFPLPELSMGMSHDLETAVEEGATWVRVGTAIFGERPRRPTAASVRAQIADSNEEATP